MVKLCFNCAKYMGEEESNNEEEILYSVCDDCYRKLNLDERLPDLLWAIAALREKNGRQEQSSPKIESCAKTQFAPRFQLKKDIFLAIYYLSKYPEYR